MEIEARKQLESAVFLVVAEKITYKKDEDLNVLYKQLMTLIGYMLDHSRVNAKKPNYSEAACLIGVTPKCFDSSDNRRWAKIRDDILAVFERWNKSIINSV